MLRYGLLASLAVTQLAAASFATPTSGPNSSPAIYTLTDAATFQEGCFDPCLCPIMNEAPIIGTFMLTPQSITGFIDTYQVSQVNWNVTFGGDHLRITGGGTYEIGGEFALMSRLQLDLKVGDEHTAHFDSGWIVGPAGLDDIDLTISINGIYCYDTVIHVDAAPVSSRNLVPYVVEPVSTFQVGCFGFCDCILGPEQAMRGTFVLLPLGEVNGFQQFAVLSFRGHVASAGTGGYAAHTIRGYGIYQVSSDGSSDPVLQQLSLSLHIDSGQVTEFESGLIGGGESFPAIQALVSIDGLLCFDTAITLDTAPAGP